MKKYKKVTIILGTYNRGGSLESFLQAISDIKTNYDWQIIFVDNNSTDNTKKILTDFIEMNPQLSAKYLLCKEKGVASCHNYAIDYAEGDILSFVDDDCYVKASHIDDVITQFDCYDVAFVGGGIVLHDVTDSVLTTNYTKNEIFFNLNSWVSPYYVQGANLMFRKADFIRLGGFDTKFGAGGKFSGADADLCNRMIKAGLKGMFSPKPVVEHHHGRKDGNTRKLEMFYAFGFGALVAKNISLDKYGFNCLKALINRVRDFIMDGNYDFIVSMAKGLVTYFFKYRLPTIIKK